MTTIDTDTRVKRSGWHPVNVGHFVMGVAFLGIVLIWILIESDAVTGDDIRWLLPVPWVLAGVAGLLATTRRKHPEVETYDVAHRGWIGREEAAAPVDEPDGDHSPYDDLDEKLARAERETQTATPVAPPEPDDPADADDPADPDDPADESENGR